MTKKVDSTFCSQANVKVMNFILFYVSVYQWDINLDFSKFDLIAKY